MTKPNDPATPHGAAEIARQAVIKELEDVKAEEIVVIGLTGKSDIADYMIIATGRSQRQVGAAAERVRKAVKSLTGQAPAIEGLPAGDWVLIDSGDVIVHIFRPEVREFYNLEKMWSADLPLEGAEDASEGAL
ncbi:MAG: ribosome silencing factor [Rhodospirillaceae bacterium]|nr:ribosome silencing factor [Rhodospirillaceae bacterium]